jgi:hypothetical protein
VPYRKYYNLESYLFDEVGSQFRATGKLSALDLYLVLAWKANRAKTKTKNRLVHKAGSFAAAARQISKAIHKADSPKNRLRVLMCDWGLRLPTATALLAVLYPKALHYLRCSRLWPIEAVREHSELEVFRQIVGVLFGIS